MKEVIVRLTSDHIKVKGAEYVQDLARCKECGNKDKDVNYCHELDRMIEPNDFCCWWVMRDE